MKIFMLFLTTFLTLQFSANAQADRLIGTWETIDDKDNEPASHILIYERDGKLFGKITKLFDQPDDRLCDRCEGDMHNKPLMGMEILTNLEYSKDTWSGGRILDPENGKTYKCKITLEDEDTLNLRGYIGFPALGRTQNWYRVK